MRKGIVMEQRKEDTIVMTSDGAFHRAERLAEAEVGMEVNFQVASEQGRVINGKWFFQRSQTKIIAVAVALLLALFPFSFWYGNNQAYAYVNIDINPSIELKLNNKLQVLEIKPQNEDAEEIVSMLDEWKREDASAITYKLIQLSKENGYVNTKNQVLIGVSYLESDRKVDVSQQFESYLSKQPLSMSVAAFDIPDELRKQARNEQSTVNELVAKKIESEPLDKSSSRSSVEIADDDKAIIQSFYNEKASSSQEAVPVRDSPSEKEPSVKQEEAPVTTEETHFKNSNTNRPFDTPPRGKENAPGQEKGSNNLPSQAKDKQNSSHKGEGARNSVGKELSNDQKHKGNKSNKPKKQEGNKHKSSKPKKQEGNKHKSNNGKKQENNKAPSHKGNSQKGQ